MSFWRLDACALLDAYKTLASSPVDVVEESLLRIERTHALINAVIAISPAALDEARASRARWQGGIPIGPLDGVPVLVKDNLEVAGLPATFGSALYADHVPRVDELPIRRLRDAGAIILGKTNCPEFAVEGYTSNALHGTTLNPYDLRLTPGGSSGGSVAAVAAGLAPVAIGTDGGGSLRRPAAYTDIFGLKPTVGTVARSAALPQLLLDYEVVGPLARSVRDLDLVLRALTHAPRSTPEWLSRPTSFRSGGRARILYVEQIAGSPCDPGIRERCAAAADRFAALRHEIVRGQLPDAVRRLNDVWPLIGQVGLAHLKARVPDFETKAGAKYVAMALSGERIAARELYGLLELVDDLRGSVGTILEDVDVIMSPACAAMPWDASEAYPLVIDAQAVGPRGHAVFTGWVNATHLPAIAVPADRSVNDLPVGFQLVGNHWSERMLIELAREYESACLPETRWPDMADASPTADPATR